ncbi:MAG: DUF933 domain-containing protein [Candidatus Omnitrophota bacterium]
MKIGIIGLPQTGKKTFFEVLTKYVISEKDLASTKALKSLAEIRDTRFDTLLGIYNPKKQVRARIEIELLPKIEKDVIAKGEIFKNIAELDAICHVARSFTDEAVYHISGSVDAKRDIDLVNAELVLSDLLFIEKRLERIDAELKKSKNEVAAKERVVLAKFKEQLDKELPLRLLTLDKDEKKYISSYPFVTLKKMVVVLNCSENSLRDTALLEKLRASYAPLGIEVMQACAKAEAEIARLETEEERKEFLGALGIAEPAINALTRSCIKALNLISFFTVGEDEVRQWPIPAGSSAPEAAGAIHSDLQKGFIRAEVMKYDDLVALGSEEKVKQAGKFGVKGKEYIVQDGDILSIRFNV